MYFINNIRNSKMDMSLPHEQIVRGMLMNEISWTDVEERMLYARSRGYLDTELKLKACLGVYAMYLRMKADSVDEAKNG